MDNYIIDSALVLAFTELIKRVTKVPSRFVPLVSLALALGLTILKDGFSQYSVFAGLVVGLTASGLYSSTKAVAGK